MVSQVTFDQWVILELMGHVRLAGRVTEEEHFGAKLGRIEIPNEDGTFTTQWFGGGSVYRITPTTEEIARAVAYKNKPAPVSVWEMKLPPAPNLGQLGPPNRYSGSRLPDDGDETENYDEEDDEDEGMATHERSDLVDDREPIQPGDYRYYTGGLEIP